VGLINTIVDKGLLALLLLLAGYVTTRSIGHLKSSLAWGAEVLRQKLLQAKGVIALLSDLPDAHLQIINNLMLSSSNRQHIEEYLKLRLKVEKVSDDARLLFSATTVRAILEARHAAINCLVTDSEVAQQFQSSPGRIAENEGGSPRIEVSEKSRTLAKQEKDKLKTAIDAAIFALQREIPSE
jgi:hypothetical protein